MSVDDNNIMQYIHLHYVFYVYDKTLNRPNSWILSLKLHQVSGPSLTLTETSLKNKLCDWTEIFIVHPTSNKVQHVPLYPSCCKLFYSVVC